jgi:hypothetical protein
MIAFIAALFTLLLFGASFTIRKDLDTKPLFSEPETLDT